MRNMSFAFTKEQILNRTKTVTRRRGWADMLKPGDLIRAAEAGEAERKATREFVAAGRLPGVGQ